MKHKNIIFSVVVIFSCLLYTICTFLSLQVLWSWKVWDWNCVFCEGEKPPHKPVILHVEVHQFLKTHHNLVSLPSDGFCISCSVFTHCCWLWTILLDSLVTLNFKTLTSCLSSLFSLIVLSQLLHWTWLSIVWVRKTSFCSEENRGVMILPKLLDT